MFLFFLGARLNLGAQERVVHYPVRFTQYFHNTSFQNPAMACSQADGELYMGNQRLVGNLSKVSSYFLQANFRLAKRNNLRGPFSALGIILYNDREGKYLNRTRAYAVYAWHANIFKEIKMSAGLRLGFMNYAVKGTPLSGGGSAINPDASFGMQLYRKSNYFGVSINQLFGSEVQPLEQITYLAPYINIGCGAELSLSENIFLNPSASARIPFTPDSRILISANASINLYQRIEPGLGIHNNEKLTVHLGIPGLRAAGGKMEFQISYAFLVFNKKNLLTPIVEIGAEYKFGTKKF